MVDSRVTDEFISEENHPSGWQIPLMTRLTPPAQQSRLLLRSRIDTLLDDAADFPLTVLVAPAGSGKTTALAGFALRSHYSVVWCRASADDDAVSLVCHLVAAFRVAGVFSDDRFYAEIAHGMVHSAEGAEPIYSPRMAVDALVNKLTKVLQEPTILVLDDYHQADEQDELRCLFEHLVANLPKRLHLVFSTRYAPLLASLPIARARGEVYHLEQLDIAFTVEEEEALFALYDRPCRVDTTRLNTFCRGWPLVLQMLASNQEGGSSGSETSESGSEDNDVLAQCLENISPLLDQYLKRQVFDVQPPALQDFLLRTSCLRWFDAEVCADLPLLSPIVPYLAEIERRCLFLESFRSGQFEYQPLFHLFLGRLAAQQLTDRREIHLQAAEYYRGRRDWEQVIFHLLEVGESEQAAEVLRQTTRDWLRQGRAMILLNWLDRLPRYYQYQADFLEARADSYRQLGHFDQALQVYKQAERTFRQQGNDVEGQARALRGQAEVYLDTVQPAPAEQLLDQALTMLPLDRRLERAQIMLLQAENWANRGRADVAIALETSARDLAREVHRAAKIEGLEGDICPLTLHTESQQFVPSPWLSPRLLLRSGRLNESRRLLEAELGLQEHGHEENHSSILAHREPVLLLALLYAMLGNGAKAVAMSLRGLLESLQGGSQLTEAIAHMRVGHAHLVIAPVGADTARRHYHQAMELVEHFGVTRTRVEGCMGLALLHGHSGNLVEAEGFAQEGLEIASAAGDEWIAAMTWLSLGGAAVAISDAKAVNWLEQAEQRFINGGDNYGQACVALWKAIWFLRTEPAEAVQQQVARLLALTQQYGYEGLLTAPTLFGPRDMAMLIPLLLVGRTLPEHATLAQQLLRQAFPTVASDETVEEYHPGYTLRIQMLGGFRVWRGMNEIHSREWQREKARQLLQLLLTYRGQWIQREQICAWLWPDSDLDASERQFKVTLNALNTALEPFRPPRTAPFFVRRQGLAYSFAPSYGCWIDVDEFEMRTTNIFQGDPDFVLRNAQIAVNLYQGDYLAESLYDSWTLEERERLLARYLATATALATQQVERGEMQQAIQMCEQVLRRDRCYEEAYQVLMRAYARRGSRSQALRSYDRCVHALQDELGIEPLPETTQIYERIKQNLHV